MFELYNPIQEQLNALRDMRRYHQEMTDADIVASLNVQFADSLENEESESVQPVPSRKPSHKQRRAARRVQNARHKSADRRHGKRRKDSVKNLRRWEDDQAQMERAQVMWHLNNKGEYVPRPIDRKYHERRYSRTTDTSRIPVYYVDTANHLDMEYRERKRTIKRGCVVYDYVPAIVTPEAVKGEPV